MRPLSLHHKKQFKMKYEQLVKNILKKKSFLCVGLDSDFYKLPKCIMDFEFPVFEFNKRIIDHTANFAVAYKPNLAFYEALGAAGWISLEMTANYIKKNYPDIFLIADAKRGDIGNTSKMYAKAFLQDLAFDSITVNPYMGEDSVTPFLSYPDKWVILLALTSNNGAFDFQFIRDEKTSDTVFETVLKVSQKWGDKNNMMYVVGATQADMLTKVRKIAPEHFILVPGIGAQGGDLEDVVKYGMNKNIGLLINSSRDIIYAEGTDRFADAAGEVASNLQKKMEDLINKYIKIN